MSHNHETVSKQKHPAGKLVRVCDAVAIAFYIIIVGGFYLYISRNVGVQYDYYEKPFVFLPAVCYLVCDDASDDLCCLGARKA